VSLVWTNSEWGML